ncbi:phosphoribosylaminoimidazolesuccinocarboxamide synthase [Formosa algae]|uniref:phosphoribosylaminoimidazolesuccinocarboxamide synthase n=1 Tax=Formosa algae TaxID=225843 RepID=UPI000CCF5B5B|nr:phosphoribosylaminoimidazolesuccinocarboxamide synthase [Formosa algae]PNW29133.1 phosphoribosylaminoimidazolesuccinocarboxamide synthase [Formosa algae]
MEKQFKTKTGFCHILPDKIILTRDGIIGNVAKVAVGKSITRVLIIYGGISAFLLYSAFDSFQTGQVPISIFYLIMGLFLMYGICSSFNNSTTPIIERKDIKNIKFKKAILGITRSRFEIHFRDENGKIKKRIIMLPGSIHQGKKRNRNSQKK